MTERSPVLDRPRAWTLGWGILPKLVLSIAILTALPVAAIWLTEREPEALWSLHRLLVLLAWGLALGLLILIVHRHLVIPLRDLLKAVEALGAGDYEVPLPKTTLDETGRLTRAFERMREEIRSATEKHRALQVCETVFNAIEEELFVVSPSFLVLRANQAVARRAGKHAEALIGVPCHHICPAGGLYAAGECPGRKVIADQPCAPVEVRDPRSGRASHLSVYPIKNEQGELWAHVEVVHDITALKQAEVEASKRETLRLLGEMAAGVAHDVNNLLAIILGYTEQAKARVQGLPEVSEALETVEKSAMMGGEIIRRIAAFARIQQHHAAREPVALHALVEECVALSRHKWEEQPMKAGGVIRLAGEFGHAGRVLANAPELRVALLNLIFNAVDAMPKGGALSLRTFQKGEWAVVEVADTGAGMSEEVKHRAFDPFFTTKGERGTGLGLSIVRNVVDQHEGKIEVESSPDHGTTFRIRLPITAQEPEESRTARSILPIPPAMVLVVEDQKPIRTLLGRTLKEAGCIVVEAATGSEALWLFDRGAFNLVITDLAMPEGSGLDLMKAVRARRSGVPIILVTGYADLLDEESAHLPTAIVRKPFTTDEVIQAVRSALR